MRFQSIPPSDENEKTTGVRAQVPVGEPVPPTVAVVVVHGMGEQREGETLLEWAEPLLGRIDWALCNDPKRQPGQRPGVRITSSSLGVGSSARVDATVHAAGVDDVAISFLEATWSRSFVPVTRVETFRWGTQFLWRALGRLFRQVRRTVVWVPLLSLRNARSLPARARAAGATVFGLIFGALALVLTAVTGILGSIVLTLASPLLLVPGIKLLLQPVIDTLVAYVGDVATYKRHPLRAAAMEGVVIRTISRAHTLLQDAPGSLLVVIAHSQGSAITMAALLDGSLDTGSWNTHIRLNTVGAAVSLISASSFRDDATDAGFAPVGLWASAHPRISWENFWGIWDPVPSGPMGDTNALRDARWRALYVRNSPGTVGPGEHPVHNTSSPLSDHQSYAKNLLQVIDPLVGQLSPAAAKRLHAAIPTGALRQMVALRRSRPVVWLLSAVMAIPLAGWWMPPWTTRSGDLLGALAPLAVAGVVVVALIWAYGWWSSVLERAVVWPQSPGPTSVVVGTPLTLYALGAIVSLIPLLWPIIGGWVWLATLALVALTGLLIYSVFSTPPRPLPERRHRAGQAPT